MASAGTNGQLLALVERIERLEEEKATFTTDIKEVYGEAKSEGFDVKILRRVIAMRKLAADERKATAEMVDRYLSELGML